MSGSNPPPSLPELGPLLGRLITPPESTSQPAALLEPARLELLTALFDRAGAARQSLAAGDAAAARASLGPAAWLEAWDKAVIAALAALTAEIDRRLKDAARIARLPARQLLARLPTPDDRRVLSARLAAQGIGLEAAAARMDRGATEWSDAVRWAAGELEGAWEGLVATARSELAAWDARGAEIRAWRRPWTSLIAGGTVLVAVFTWLGLVLGGFLPVPDWLRPAAEWVWNLP